MRNLYQQTPAQPLTHVTLLLPRTGACLDPPERQGLSRLMGRLMFMGAGGLGNTELNGRLERLGASMGFSTANDHFALRLVTLTENLDAALELFLLSFREPNLDAGEFDRLKKEQLSGWIAEREESKQIRAQEVYLHQIFRNEPTGYLPDGTAEGIAACRVEDVRAHFAHLFTGDEPILAVLTDLSRGEAQERVVERIVQERTAREGTYPWEGFEPKNGSGRRVIIVPDKETNTDEIVFGAFTTCEKDPDWHVHRVITHIFGGDMNSRLFRIVRGDRGLSSGASCWYESAHGRCPRDRMTPFSIYTFPAAEHTAEALPLVVSLYEELVAGGVTEDELALAQKALINSHPFLRDTPQKLLALEADLALYGVDTDDEASNREKIQNVTLADVQRVLRQTHHPEGFTMVLLGDPHRLEPLAAGIESVERLETITYPKPLQDG